MLVRGMSVLGRKSTPKLHTVTTIMCPLPQPELLTSGQAFHTCPVKNSDIPHIPIVIAHLSREEQRPAGPERLPLIVRMAERGRGRGQPERGLLHQENLGGRQHRGLHGAEGLLDLAEQGLTLGDEQGSERGRYKGG